MQALVDKIKKDGTVLPGDILKVDGFINQQIDIGLLNAMGKEFAGLFEGVQVDRILTVEASGIAIAAIAAQYFGNVPVVFAKKHKTLNMGTENYTAKIFSYTHNTEYDVAVSKKFINPGDHVLIIDDFLANGAAINGMLELIKQAGAVCVGAGIAIEKGFQNGGADLRAKGLRVESLAIIESMDDTSVTFRS